MRTLEQNPECNKKDLPKSIENVYNLPEGA